MFLILGGFFAGPQEKLGLPETSASDGRPVAAGPQAPFRDSPGVGQGQIPDQGSKADAGQPQESKPTEADTTDVAGNTPTTLKERQIPRGNCDLVVEAVDVAGEPFGDVVVTLNSVLGRSRKATDDQGEAHFSRIIPGFYQLHVLAPEGAELVSARPIVLAAGEERWVTIRVDDVGDFKLSISGRILNGVGVPVAGITVEASRHLFDVADDQIVPRDQSGQRTTSDEEGLYKIENLVEGEYLVRTLPTERYASSRIIVRSGVESADLMLSGSQTLQVHGKVGTAGGHPLQGVLVTPLGQQSPPVRSGKEGDYSIQLALSRPDRVYTLRFGLENYRNFRLNISGEEAFSATGELEVDVELEPIGETAPVEGVLIATDNGDGIAGETVYLHSPSINARYIAVSGEDGRFFFPDVQVTEDYRLWIYPRGFFTDHTRYPVKVPRSGLELRIELDPLEVGRLSGRMVDGEGNPLPGFTIWLRSTRSRRTWVEVTGDEKGRFLLEDAPAGKLLFDTRSPPYIRAQGAELAADGEEEVQLVIDWGHLEIVGTVTDDRGQPLAGVRVDCGWTKSDRGILNSSRRQLVTDELGRFRITQLGAGRHQLRATLPGFKSHVSTHDVGRDKPELTIELKP